MGATFANVQLSTVPAALGLHPVCPGRGIKNVPPKMLLFRFRMLSAVGSTVPPNSAAEVVPSGLVAKIGMVAVVLDEFGSTALRARIPCVLTNQKPPARGTGPLALNPSTFCRNFWRFRPL